MKQNKLDELPIAKLSEQQLQHLRAAEEEITKEGTDVYLIAFEKQAPSQ
ncbi:MULTISPECIES: hypothetical protein [Brevibacillus]|uniref:Uncharacterized protein n=1 Tax=Brevibacillus borstelensis AK1 TaxID=1300222 RepID=M8D7B4_9BACL|nr:hypothetical protein [Brevibacillus borstelensis]EMT52114.1 hypothetical protein I532_14763 [Brevibacillus borstelensis AK1]MBE5396004.1 hypothetical protein [Brevibacillus borstelensis]MCC0565423.1 hypothetical protein [Brevibacillus borstelensis]MCM3471433.1 hypothetical protein [Brevibacillus borstelensis]MCM3559523.1 hypothetical protein [Brevibacillus borstelensis]